MLATMTLWLAAIPTAPPEVPRPVRETGLAATVRMSDPATGSVGSGVVFAVRDGYAYVLTAAHVLGPDAKPRVETFAPGAAAFAHDGGELLFRVTESDLAVVRLLTGKREWAATPLAPLPAGGARVDAGWAVGCDDGKEPRVEAVTLTGRKLVRSADGPKAFFWEATGAAPAGRSGGPLLDGDGHLIGVCSGTQGGKSYYTHPDEIRKALEDHRLKWTLEVKAGR